jgi:hypothetical protein
LAQFKRVEVARVKLEEKASFQGELQRQKIEYENKLVAVQARNAELVQEERNRLAERERAMDKQYLSLKQDMLDGHNNVIIKEKQMRNDTELSAKEIAMERDQLKRRVDEVQEQMIKLSEFKERYTQKMEESMSQYKIDLTKEYSSLLSTVEIERAKLQGDRLVLNEKEILVERLLIGARKTEEEAAVVKIDLQELQSKLDEMTRSRDKALSQMNDLQLQALTSKGSASLEFEISSLKRYSSNIYVRQLISAEKATDHRQQDYEALIKSLIAPKEDSIDELAEARQSELRWKQKCQDLIMKLDNEVGG